MINSHIMLYAASGWGKTTQVGELARSIHATGRTTRLASRSGGGWASIQHLVDTKIIEAIDLTSRKYCFESCDRLSRGWWPQDVADPDSPLIPPPYLKADFPNWKGNWQSQETFNQVGLFAFDAMSEIADWIMDEMMCREAAGERFSTEKPAIVFGDHETKYATSAMAHYNTVQRHLHKCASLNSRKLLRFGSVMWTSLEDRAKDENTGMPIYGPKLVGSAMTGSITAWFEQALHGWSEPSAKGGKVRRLYLTSHFDEYKIEFKAKNTAPWSHPLPEYLEGKDVSLARFFELLDESRKKANG